MLKFEIVIRTILVRENRRMDHDSDLNETNRARIEQAAKLEGITVTEAMEKKRGFRYLL